MFRKSSLAFALIVVASGAARADIIGFGGNGTGYSENTGGSNTGPSITSNVLTLTDQNVNEANSVFNDTPQTYASGFAASFTYTDVSTGGANGIVFVLENDPHGTAAVGGNGGSIGFAGGGVAITSSVGVIFSIYNGSGSGINDSDNTWTQSTGTVDMTNGAPVNIVISYDPVLTRVYETLSQGSNSFTSSRMVDLSSTVGDFGDAFVGFTAGTGDTGAVQTISNFSYITVPEPAAAGLLGLSAAIALARRRRNRLLTATDHRATR